MRKRSLYSTTNRMCNILKMSKNRTNVDSYLWKFLKQKKMNKIRNETVKSVFHLNPLQATAITTMNCLFMKILAVLQ